MLNRRFPFGGISGGNPLANALMLAAGALVLGAAVVLGFFVFAVFASGMLILASIVGLRLWWMNRRLRGKASSTRAGGAGDQQPHHVIEGEYRVVSSRRRGTRD